MFKEGFEKVAFLPAIGAAVARIGASGMGRLATKGLATYGKNYALQGAAMGGLSGLTSGEGLSGGVKGALMGGALGGAAAAGRGMYRGTRMLSRAGMQVTPRQNIAIGASNIKAQPLYSPAPTATM